MTLKENNRSGRLYYSQDSKEYIEVTNTSDLVPRFIDSGVPNTYDEFATIGEATIPFKIKDKYFAIYKRTKKKRIKKKQLKKMSSMCRFLLNVRELVKDVDPKEVVIKVDGYFNKEEEKE